MIETHCEQLTEVQKQLIERVAQKIVRWRATVPAIFALETMKPLSFVGSQFLITIGPLAEILFRPGEYEQFVLAMENRDNVEFLLRKIEDIDSTVRDEEIEQRKRAKELRKRRKQERRAKRSSSKSERRGD